MNEFELIRRYFTPLYAQRAEDGVSLGIGDDAALLAPRADHELAVTTDTLIAGRHFPAATSAYDIGWKALAVNLSSAFHTTRLILPGMRQRDFGRIVNIASIFGLRAVVNRVDYVTTKTALIGFTRAVALETAAQNITCNAICPGSSPTPAIEQRLADFMAKENLPRDEAVKAFMGSRQPSGRFVSPERVAGLVAFLCGPDGGDTTGSAISIDGGWSAA